jgi:O-antigen/teichoic acid export membrane protein
MAMHFTRLERYGSALGTYFHRLEPSLLQRIATGVTWSIVGAGFASGLAMAASVACARFLGSTHFGELAIVLATTNLFSTLLTSGLSMTASKYVAEHRDADPARAGAVVGLSWATSIVIGAVVMILIVPLSPWLSRDVLGTSGLARALSLGAVVMFFGALNGSQIGVLNGLEAFDQTAIGNLVRGIGVIVFVTSGAALGGVAGALWGHVGVGMMTALYYQIIVRQKCVAKGIAISYSFSKDNLRILWRFTLPVLLTTLSFAPAAWWSNVMLANKSGYSEAGVFNAAFHWQLFILFFSNAISRIGLPMLSNLRAEHDAAKYKHCLAISFVLTSVPAFAIAIPVALGSRFIVSLYGPSFEHGAAALSLISLAAVLSAMNIMVGHAIWSLEATTPAVLLAALNGASLVLASYALAGNGAVGLAGAYVITGLIQTAVNIPFMGWLLKRKFATSNSVNEIVLA